MFNMNLASNRCPRCNEIETWSHVMQCESLRTVNEGIMEETCEEFVIALDPVGQVVKRVRW